MSQSTTDGNDTIGESQQTACQNGGAKGVAADLSNGFEHRKDPDTTPAAQLIRRQSTSGCQQPELLPGSQPIAQQQQYGGAEKVQCVSQTSTQTLPVQTQPQYAPPEYPEQGQYLARGPFYNQNHQFAGERAGYVTGRDVTALFQGQYVAVQQSASPQPAPPPPFLVLPSSQGYPTGPAPPQYPYSQYPQTVMNPVPFASAIYPNQQYNCQASPNTQRYSQELAQCQYQSQPIIQPIAQNVTHGAAGERPSRGPKPMVPPRGNSKITHDPGHRKSASIDAVPSGLQKVVAAAASGAPPTLEGDPSGRYLAPINQNPRTRQDGLYVDANGEPKLDPEGAGATGIYVSRSEHRKSVSVDVTTSFQRRNDTVTFTFPGDTKTGNSALRVSPMAFERKGKPDWAGSVSPNQRACQQEANRRSDYFEEHRRSPMNLEGKDVRRSPMPFVPIRDASCERAAQKSPSFANQNFEKTRQELALWADQRQRQELERMQGPVPGGLLLEIQSQSPPVQTQMEPPRPVGPQPQVLALMEGQQRAQNLLEAQRNHHQLEQPRQVEGQRAVLGGHVAQMQAQLFSTSPRGSRNPSEDRKGLQSAFQPIANINQSAIMEQRRHLRHVSADLTKHLGELRSKEFEEGVVTGSVMNLGPQRASPNQFSTGGDPKVDPKGMLTIVTDFGDPVGKPAGATDQVDHIIHSHRKSHALLTHSKSQMENLENEKRAPEGQQQQQQNQQCLDMLSEKLTLFERQQNDLQMKLQCLQNQNQILDKVAQFQSQQSDIHSRIQTLQSQGQYHNIISDTLQINQEIIDKHHQNLLTLSYQGMNHGPQEQKNLLSPRMDPGQVPQHISQMPLPCLPQELPRAPFAPQFHRVPCQIDNHDIASQTTSATNVSFTGTLKKVPPEKPPRTSLIVQSPDTESNRSQPAIGLKQTPKTRPTIFGTVASDLNPKDGNSRRSLPQTPAGSVGKSSATAGLVNGSNADHQDVREGAAINPEHALVYRDGNLVSGSLEALVQHMVPTEDYYPDRAYLFAFLLSARLFIKPHELLGEVCALCEHQQNLNGEGGKERLHRFVPRLVQLLAEWTETFPYDFRDERVMGHVRSIIQKVAVVDAAARQEVSALLENLLIRLNALEKYEEGLAKLATEAATEQLTQVDVTELCPSATVLAQQLTHVELERLSYIGPEEFVQAFAKESPHLETSFKDMKKTRNLESYVQWFNRLSYFVATEVCKHAKKKQRVRVVEYWIETARECFNIGNFNSLMAIIAGLSMSPITRLKKTWSKVQRQKFSVLEVQMDPGSNFSSYRSTLKAAMWRSAGATDERQRIVVPFFSLLVKDLYFLNEGCSNKLPNGHINFEKFWQLAKQVTEFIAWKQVACPFEKNPRVIAFLQASPVLNENTLALASFECEPPDSNPEKERYKALKSELNAQ